MKPRPFGHGSRWPAHGYWLNPSTFWPGWSGSHRYDDTSTFGPTAAAPVEPPPSLYACTDTAMHVFVAPRCSGRIVRSLGHAVRRSQKGTPAAPPGPAAPHRWDRVGAAF